MTASKFTRRSVLSGAAAFGILPQVVPAQEREVEGGIGGTGIVGLLTDFGSLIVAGRAVETNGRTVFTDGFGAIAEASLAIGDSLTVEAARENGVLVARRVHVTHPLVGRVTQLTGTVATVNGVKVTLTPDVGRPEVGKRIAVSGLWRGPNVIASRIVQARSSDDLVAGDVSRDFGGTMVGGVRANDIAVSRLPEGSFAAMVGAFDPSSGRMRVRALQTQRFTEAAGTLRTLAVEGFLEPTRAAPGFRISGLGHSFARNLDLSPFAASRTLFAGPYTGTFDANSAIELPEATGQRRELLRSLSR